MHSLSPYFADESVTLWHGDSLGVLRTLPDQSVDCCVTSPPYFGLRDYGEDGQYGLEASPAEYVETMRAVFSEVRRVLADDGTLWLNLGDSWNSSPVGSFNGGGAAMAGRNLSGYATGGQVDKRTASGLPPKNLLGIPWRTAFALQDDGWILRSEVIWNKASGMPESVVDRPSRRHEHVFMLAKSQQYFFDLDAIREERVYSASSPALKWNRDSKEAAVPGQSMRQHRSSRADQVADKGKNPGDVWTIATQPFTEAHFAVMPQVLAERCLVAGCKPDGTVLDPFSGSGTTGLAAAKHGRRYVGIDLSSEYLDLSLRTRLGQTALLDGGVA